MRSRKNDLRAELLTEVLNATEDDDDNLKPIWDNTGNLKAVKVGKKVPLPVNPEQLRTRLNLMAASWNFVALVHTTRDYLKDATPEMFVQYADYLLGPHVMGLICEEPGQYPVGKSWEILLSY